MKLSILGPILLLLLIAIVSISGVVHNIPLVQHRSYGKEAEVLMAQRKAHDNELGELLGEQVRGRPFSSRSHQRAGKRIVTNFVDSLRGDITVGTPAQTFAATYEFFYKTDLVLFDTNATFKYYTFTFPHNGAKFNSSGSTTYASQGQNFTLWYEKGHTGRDLVNISGILSNLSFAVVDEVSYYDYYYRRNGTVGLAGWNSTSNVTTNLLTQLTPQLDEPIVSLWTNFTYAGTGTAQITLGAKDTRNCKSDWVFNQRLNYPKYMINATSIVAKNADGSNVASIQGKLVVGFDNHYWDSDASPTVFSLLVAASGAAYNRTLRVYTTSCNVSEIGSVEINLGNGNNTNNRLVLTAADFIDFWPSTNLCYINAYDWGTYGSAANFGTIYLGRQFLDNHCVGYNAGNNQFGFATSIKSTGIVADPPPASAQPTVAGDDYDN